jgi:hypothetical protein
MNAASKYFAAGAPGFDAPVGRFVFVRVEIF